VTPKLSFLSKSVFSLHLHMHLSTMYEKVKIDEGLY